MKNRQCERGVALLFALGVLSLMLVTGLAFLGNSLISQKIAVNNSESNFARQLARSAAERAMAQLAMFSLLQSAYHDEAGAYDASSIYSSLRFSEQANSTDAGTRNDGLSAKMQIPDVGSNASFTGYGEQSKAKWLYVYDNGEISDDASTALTGTPKPKIIGRYAYQVLPQTSRSRLSLFAVTAGAKKIADYSGSDADRKIPHIHRWGVDVDELLIPGLTDGSGAGIFTEFWGRTPHTDNDDPQYEFDNFFNLFSSNTSPNHLYVPADATDAQKALSQNYKNWIRNIFAEGKERIAIEAYTDNASSTGAWYPRFNLGRFANGENWYERFIKGSESETVDAVKNNDTIIDRLTRHPGKGITIAGTESAAFKYVDGYKDDSQYDPFGLPFLRRIGSDTEKGGFDTVANLRKQIAANLNDYCDDDDIPTSNVPAKDWASIVEKSDAADLPAYTGNEKTHYINEIALGVQLTGAKFDNSGKFVGKVDAEVLAELIRIYDSVSDISKYKLHGYFKHLALTFSVTFRGSVKVDYTNNADSTPGSSTVNIDEELSKESAVKFDPALLKDFVISWSDSDKRVQNGPYCVANWQSTDEQRSPLNIDFSEEIKKKVDLTGKTVTGITVDPSNVTVKLLKVEYNITNLALMINDAAAYGVDFVKLSAPSSGDGHEISIPEDKQKLELFDATIIPETKKGIIHIGIMQAIDPRQNLNAIIKNSDNKTSDWYITAEPTISFAANKSQWEWERLKTRVSAGNVNFCSNPNVPKYADGTEIDSTNRDKEETADPAWQDKDKDKHISTAVIRNAPMRSPWELGFIHRGIPFQTINLKGVGTIDESSDLAEDAHKPDNFKEWDAAKGTLYKNGDAGILDQIKMTSYNKSFGKVDLESLAVTAPWWEKSGSDPTVEKMNLAVLKSLFNKIRRQQAYEFLEESVEDNKVYVNAGTLTGTPYTIPADLAVPSAVTSVLRSKILKTDAAKWVLTTDTTDAAAEELIGKTFNLIEGRSFSTPNVFRILIVAQSIRDLQGPLSRWDLSTTPNLVPKSTDAAFGVFDVENGLYYDEIMGECRMLVTVEKVHYLETVGTGKVPRARLRVKQIEYLD